MRARAREFQADRMPPSIISAQVISTPWGCPPVGQQDRAGLAGAAYGEVAEETGAVRARLGECRLIGSIQTIKQAETGALNDGD